VITCRGRQYATWVEAEAKIAQAVAVIPAPVEEIPDAPPVAETAPQPPGADGRPLPDRYRPALLADVIGQPAAVAFLQRVANAPAARALLAWELG
jgi:hypothetical protein